MIARDSTPALAHVYTPGDISYTACVLFYDSYRVMYYLDKSQATKLTHETLMEYIKQNVLFMNHPFWKHA